MAEAADVSSWKAESELAKLEAQWDEAVRTYDVAMLDRLMSIDFSYFGQGFHKLRYPDFYSAGGRLAGGIVPLMRRYSTIGP